MPRRHNLRSLIAVLPRIWNQPEVHSHIIEGGRFQFVFPTEESMETVLRRGPWAFADRMVVLQRWAPYLMPDLLNFILFWIQIRGIPLQFMNQEVLAHIGRAMGLLVDVDYNAEAIARVEYARVCLNLDVTQPLRFQKNFQFTQGINSLLRFRYERLRGFCEVCGMITHDSGACLIQNGGLAHLSDDEDDDDDLNREDEQERRGLANGVIRQGLYHNGVEAARDQVQAEGARVEEIVDEEADDSVGEEREEEEEAPREDMDSDGSHPAEMKISDLPYSDLHMREIYSTVARSVHDFDMTEACAAKEAELQNAVVPTKESLKRKFVDDGEAGRIENI